MNSSTIIDLFKKPLSLISKEFIALKNKYTTKESDFFNFEDMQIHYRKTGSGPALLLVHGIGSSLHTWSEWHNLLSDSFTVISLDTPGFGLSGSHPKKDYSIEMYNRCFKNLLDHLKIDKTYMVGNSLGGIMTWQFALAYPGQLLKIVLMDAGGFVTTKSELTDIGFILSIHPLTAKLSQLFTPKPLVEASYRNAVYNSNIVTKEKVDTYYDLLTIGKNRANFSIVLKNLILTNEDHLNQIRNIKLPTLIMWGEEDNLINVGDAFKFNRCIKNSKLIIYPKIGHLPMEENPEQSAMDTKKFLLENEE